MTDGSFRVTEVQVSPICIPERARGVLSAERAFLFFWRFMVYRAHGVRGPPGGSPSSKRPGHYLSLSLGLGFPLSTPIFSTKCGVSRTITLRFVTGGSTFFSREIPAQRSIILSVFISSATCAGSSSGPLRSPEPGWKLRWVDPPGQPPQSVGVSVFAPGDYLQNGCPHGAR